MVGRPGVVRVSHTAGVVVDAIKTRGDPILNVGVEYMEHDVSTKSVDHRTFAALRQGVTVDDILKLLRDRGFTRYRYDDHWNECLYWCKAVIAYLVDQGIIGSDSLKAVDEMVATIRLTSTTVWVPNDWDTFF
ncbi:hypothetical protein BD413DRAFT_185735 [Trametes elegans]|nr:hypothetical protein BD413DRAFT_185735 [Trametes elegans]